MLEGVTVATSPFRPYVSRLALEWEARASGAPARVIDASLLGLDIAGFTALSEQLTAKGKLGAEELISLISRCYSGLIETAERYGGDVLKFRGDALLLLFDGERHEERAARAALAMQSYIASDGTGESSVGPVQLRMAGGVASGPCHFFLVGAHQRELIVCGPAASATLALEDAAESGEILVSAHTAEAVRDLVAGERDGAFLLRADLGEADAPRFTALEAPDVGALLEDLIPPALRAPIAAHAIEAEHRHVTAAFIKFSGTDALVEHLAEAAESMSSFANAVSAITSELGITWLESDIDRDGGKLYLVAGAPASGGDDEERMLRAVRQIVDAHVGPPIAIGVNRGPVLAGPIGSPSRSTYAVMGDTVNLAARLGARAEKGEILVSGEVIQRSRTRFETTSRQFLMKGKAKPVTGYSLGVAAGENLEASTPSLPLVGRAEELAVLQAAVDAARLRQSGAVEIVGDPGAGKSRLLEELAAIAVGFQVLRARCEPYAASTPFAPFRTLLRPLVGVLPDDSPDAAGPKLVAFTESVMPDLVPWLPLLALPFDALVSSTTEVDEIEPAFRRDRLHDVLEQFLGRLLLMPTALLVEDTHWLDDASQLLLRRLLRSAPRPWLTVVTRRPSGPQLVEDGGTLLELGPLPPDDARTLALAAAGETALSEEQLAAVTQRAGGNALFVRELALAPPGASALPETVEALLTTRIDTLDPADRLLLRHAAVIGPAFDLDLLDEILPEEIGDPELWSRLADFVEWDGPAVLRFRHDLVRTAAYDGLSFARRHEIHARVGNAIERRAADPTASAEILSLHFLTAGLYDKAWRYSVLAGDDARAKYANIDAATFYERGLAAAGGTDPPGAEVTRVTEALGDVRELAAHYDEADAAYARSLELGGDRARLLRKRGLVGERRGRYEEALELYDLAAANADPADSVALQLGRAIVHYRQGRIEECARWAALAAEGAETLDDRAALADAFYIRAAAEGDRGGPAREFLDRSLAIFEELGLLHRQATVLNNMGVRAYYEGAWDEALELYLRSEQAVQRAGDVLTGGHGTNNRAEILLDQGRLPEATELFERALRTYRAAKFPVGEALVTINLGRLAAAEGRFADAARQFDDASAQLTELGSESFLIEAEARRAEAFVLEGRHDDAASLAERALDGMTRTGEVGVRSALLERVLGLAAVQARRRDDAPPHLDKSLQVARELGADYEVARTLRARVATGLAADGESAEADAILERLGVVWTPDVPLP
jgi:class 3 adenylate cyclase/tetratricopeptide (TPR) repeat protein